MSDKLHEFQHQRRMALAVLIVFLFLGLLFAKSSWQNQEIHELIEAFGIGLMVITIIGRSWSILYIGGRKLTSLVQSGPYSITRNPLYLFSIIGTGGVGAQTGSMLVAAGFAIGCALVFRYVIHREEGYLFAMFGADFAEYVQRVPRIIPNFSLFRDSETLTVSTKRLYSTFFDGLVFFVAMPCFEIVEYLQDADYIRPLIAIP